tara:strand:+ start:6077 stop:6328 length:252 start_codon:yes stop_codon:yes gene_type:complete
MRRQLVYEAAALTRLEIDLVEAVVGGSELAALDFGDTSAFGKLMDYFCENEVIPYAVVSQNLWSAENTAAPDDWIVEHLQTCS